MDGIADPCASLCEAVGTAMVKAIQNVGLQAVGTALENPLQPLHICVAPNAPSEHESLTCTTEASRAPGARSH